MVGGPPDIFERDVKEQLLSRFPFGQFFANGLVIRGTVLDGVVENGRVRRQSCNRKLVNVVL